MYKGGKTLTYWWSEEIEELRKKCYAAREQLKKGKESEGMNPIKQTYTQDIRRFERRLKEK